MVNELWLIHHSHTDIGFTQPQRIVFELHSRFIDEALDLMDQTADFPDEAQFRWTCESAGIAWQWWQQASGGQRRRFMEAVQIGRVDVAAFRWNLTPLADHALFAQQLQEAGWLRAEGVPIRSAMQSDINGLPWGTVRLLLDHGIDGFSMAINEHFGRAVTPRPGAFWWAAPDGQTILTYNGPHYHSTPNRAMRLGGASTVQDAVPAVQAYLEKLGAYGYTLPVLGLQPTNIYFSDNDSPDVNLSRFVRAWNESGQSVRLRLCTLTQYFDRLRQEPLSTLPTLSGDWTDWWNFGSGSTARETRLHLQGQRDLQVAQQLQGWDAPSPRAASLAQQAGDALSLYAEHTWGADWGAATPSSDETAIQLSHKLNYAYEGATLARYLKRDALFKLAQRIPGEGPRLMVYNPNSFAVTAMVRVPENLERYTPNWPHLAQRFDVEWNGRRGQERWVGPLALPGMGHLSLPLDQLEVSSAGLSQSEHAISNGQVTATFDPHSGGLSSLVCQGREYVRAGERLGQVVLEWPTEGRRNAIFGPPEWEAFDMHADWHHEWAARRESAEVQSNRAQLLPGAAEYQQQLRLANGEMASIQYWLHPDETALHLRVTLHLQPDTTPRATYLHLPFALSDDAQTHFETAGAAVEFDREQLPGSSRHYVTTLDWLRMQDDQAGVTVATPDAPLWQIGGYTFGRFAEEKAAPYQATLNAWLTNNYWDTNFMADQAGELRFDFTLELHAAEDLAVSAQRALKHVQKPEIQPFTATASTDPAAQLLDLDLSGIRLVGTQVDPSGQTLSLSLLNPTAEKRTVTLSRGHWTPQSASLRTLTGVEVRRAEVDDGRLKIEVPGRFWGVLIIKGKG